MTWDELKTMDTIFHGRKRQYVFTDCRVPKKRQPLGCVQQSTIGGYWLFTYYGRPEPKYLVEDIHGNLVRWLTLQEAKLAVEAYYTL